MQVERYGIGGRVFLGLHGWGSDRRVFMPLVTHVPASASFFVADLPGCGASPPPQQWSVDTIVAEIVETIRTLHTERATLVGHCGGAVFALLAARASAQLIERVVAIDPFAYLPRYFRLFTGDGFGLRAYNATFANPVGRWVTAKALNAGRDEHTDLTVSFAAVDHETERRYLHLFSAMNGVEEVRGLPTPVDLVYGERTFSAVKKSVEQLRTALPNARAFQLDGARHMPLTEASTQLAQIVFTPEEARVEDELARAARNMEQV